MAAIHDAMAMVTGSLYGVSSPLGRSISLRLPSSSAHQFRTVLLLRGHIVCLAAMESILWKISGQDYAGKSEISS